MSVKCHLSIVTGAIWASIRIIIMGVCLCVCVCVREQDSVHKALTHVHMHWLCSLIPRTFPFYFSQRSFKPGGRFA